MIFELLKRFRETLIVGALLLAPLLSYLMSGHRGRAPHVIDRAVLAASSPIQGALTWFFAGIRNGIDGYVGLRGAHEQALQCETKLAEATLQLDRLKESEALSLRMRASLGYIETTAEQEISAQVIGLNPSPQFQSIRIDRGESHGIRVGMPVVTPQGVVGHVVRSVGGSSDVLLLTDPASRIGVLMQKSRIRGTIVGTGDGSKLSLELVMRAEQPQDGDEVVTAGTDGIYPKGLRIGSVSAVSKPLGMFVTAAVSPSVDLARVVEVLIVPVVLSALSAPPPSGGTAK